MKEVQGRRHAIETDKEEMKPLKVIQTKLQDYSGHRGIQKMIH